MNTNINAQKTPVVYKISLANAYILWYYTPVSDGNVSVEWVLPLFLLIIKNL